MKIGILVGLIGSSLLGVAEEWTPLWAETAPGAAPLAEGSEIIEKGERFTNVEVPQYRLFRPEKPNGQGVVILPGGAYRIVAMTHEGYGMAEWFAQRGITAMVVKYRVSGDDAAGYQFPVPQLDARRALRIMRANADEWGIDSKKIGVLGASAGGHLAATCATLFDHKLEAEAGDAIDGLSCRPDFAVLLYPVIGMDRPWGHGGSARRLLGPESSEELRTLCSPYRQVSRETPPTFIVHCSDDQTVPLRNAAEMMSALAEKKIPVRAAIYPTGGHGFGSKGRGAAKGWLSELEDWLKGL